jgi:phenylalanyl-tRNA synthetase alpha chain
MMTTEEKVGRTLAELGVSAPAEIAKLFEDLSFAIESEADSFPADNLDEAAALHAAKNLRDRWLARGHGVLARVDQNWLKQAAKEIKPVVGAEFNALRHHANEYVDTERLLRRWSRKNQALNELRHRHDLTLPGYRRELGSIHPVTRVQREIEDIFLGLGFRIETGPEVESVYNNFDALNIPESHPSRDDWDTLYIDSQTLLRTHTSPVQIRAMRKYGAPLYIITPGKCYRNENPDATHSAMFHQIEGLAVDTDITFADLKGTLDYFAKQFFGERTRTRFQPSFFPFTEPSGEMAATCSACDGKGCRVCKESGWIELLGCGMVHPEVLRHGGIDPDRYSGWAFGLGIDRFAMIKYDVGEIQHFFQSDVRFLRQF